MDSEKKPKRPRIGSMTNPTGEPGSFEQRYEKVNYQRDNYSPRRAIQASTPSEEDSQPRTYSAPYMGGYQPRPRFNQPSENSQESSADNAENTSTPDPAVTPYQPTGHYHRQNYGDRSDYRQGGYNQNRPYNNRQGGYNQNRPYNNRQGGYNNRQGGQAPREGGTR